MALSKSRVTRKGSSFSWFDSLLIADPVKHPGLKTLETLN
jgi:hypothetical protein